jgi:hypothetical protein
VDFLLSGNMFEFGKSLDQNAILAQPLYADRNAYLWSTFPGVTQTHHGRSYAAGIYLWLLQKEQERLAKERGLTFKETPYQMRRRLMKETENKVIQRDSDDLFTLLSI